MVESDDPIFTPIGLALGASAATAAATGAAVVLAGGAVTAATLASRAAGIDIPKIEAQNPSEIAESATDLTDEQKRRKKRQAAFATRDRTEPTLGKVGLLGVSQNTNASSLRN